MEYIIRDPAAFIAALDAYIDAKLTLRMNEVENGIPAGQAPAVAGSLHDRQRQVVVMAADQLRRQIDVSQAPHIS